MAEAAASPSGAMDDAAALRFFDERVRWQTSQFADAMRDVEPTLETAFALVAQVVVGIPFYTERDNVVSQLVTLRQVFQERRQYCLIVVIGEHSRCDLLEDIAIDDIEESEPCAPPSSEPHFARLITFWKPHKRYQGKPWSVRAGQLLAAAANAHLVIVDADIQFTHFELSAHSLMRTLLDPLQGLMPQSADAPAEEHSSSGTVAAPPASMVSLNAPRSYLSDDGIVHLFSALLMHASLGTHVHQPMGGEFSLHARFNTALLAESEGGPLPQVVYDDAYCVQAQLLTRALLGNYGPVVERLMRGKWHAKIGLAKILHAPAHGKSRIDLVTERMFDDIMALSTARCTGAVGDVDLIAAGRTFRLSKDGPSNAFVSWVRRSRQLEGTHVEAAAGATASPRRYAAGRPQGSVYPDPLAQQMCVLAPPISRKEIWAALKANLREFFTRDLASLPERCSFADEVLPLLHCACNAPRGAFRVTDTKGTSHGSEPAAAVFGPEAWARATVSLLLAYRAAPPGSDARRAVVHANRLSWLLGALAFLNSTVASDWGAAHEHLDAYRVAFRAAYLRDFLSAAV